MKRLVLPLSLFLLTVACTPQLILAQSVPSDDATQIGNSINFITTPLVPGPNSSVHVQIEAFGLDLDSSTEVWSVNGKVVKKGYGLTAIDLTTGDIGSHTTIAITVTASDGSVVNRSIDFAPGQVDLMWQGDTYVPPFYAGRALWSYQSQVTLLAIPHVVGASGAELNPSTLIYKWTQDDNVLGQLSGTGKNSLTFSDSVLSLPTQIEVDVMTDQSTVVGTASITLTPEAPDLLVYEDNPLYGLILNNAIGDTAQLHDKEITFAALPLFSSSLKKNAPDLTYTWSTNDVNTTQKGPVATYRAPDTGGGSTSLHVGVVNSDNILESVDKDFLVQFGGQANI
jgi:hypothetical protein